MAESKARRWFGREHNPARKQRVQQASLLFLAALAVSSITAATLAPIGPAAWIPGLLMAVVLWGLGVKRTIEASREPHWSEPKGGPSS
jgi:hypothetical protein